jgi:hypothetical protein
MSHNLSSRLTMSHNVSSRLIMSLHVSQCLIMSQHVSSCLLRSHQVTMSHQVSSGLIRSHQVFSCLLLSHHILMYLMSSYLIVSHLLSSHHIPSIASHPIASYHTLASLESSHTSFPCMSRHFPQWSRLFKSAENPVPQWHCIAFGTHAFVHLRPQVPRSSFTEFLSVFKEYQGISNQFGIECFRVDGQETRASEHQRSLRLFSRCKWTNRRSWFFYVLFLNMDETQWNYPIQTSFLRHIWYYVLIVACRESLLRLLLLSFTSEFGVRFFGICWTVLG